MQSTSETTCRYLKCNIQCHSLIITCHPSVADCSGYESAKTIGHHLLHIAQVFVSEQKRLMVSMHAILPAEYSFVEKIFGGIFFFLQMEKSLKFEPTKILGHNIIASDPLGKTFHTVCIDLHTKI